MFINSAKKVKSGKRETKHPLKCNSNKPKQKRHLLTFRFGKCLSQGIAYLLSRLYFLLKRSTRPPTSLLRCLPVKNGWDAELVSTRITEYVLPSSHSIVSLEDFVEALRNL